MVDSDAIQLACWGHNPSTRLLHVLVRGKTTPGGLRSVAVLRAENLLALLLAVNLIWIFLFSGIIRSLNATFAGQLTFLLTFLLTVCTLLIGLKRREWWPVSIFSGAFFLLSLSISFFMQQSLVFAVISSSILLMPVAALLLVAIANRSQHSIFLRKLCLVIVFLNLGAVAIQLTFLQGVDRATGLVGNERASNTVMLALLLIVLGLLTRSDGKSPRLIVLLLIAACFAWLGDAKTALIVALIYASVVGTYGLVHSLRQKSAELGFVFKWVAATLILLVAAGLAAIGIGTGSAVVLSTNYVTDVTSKVAETAVAADYSSESDPAGNGSSRLFGSGAGTGLSQLGLLITQGRLPDALIREFDATQPATVIASYDFGYSGSSWTSLQKTLLGVLQESGLLGLFLLSVCLALALRNLRSDTPTGALWGLVFVVLILFVGTPMMEYPEVSFGIAACLLVASNPAYTFSLDKQTGRSGGAS